MGVIESYIGLYPLLDITSVRCKALLHALALHGLLDESHLVPGG
jgi:hypothetical protein